MSKRRSIQNSVARSSRLGRAILALGVVGVLGGLSGCADTDAWMLDPSIVGRWEYTPTTVPILSRITSIEGPDDEYVEISEVTPADLVPEVFEYRIGPGDRIVVVLYDIPEEGRAEPYQRRVDSRGFITLPQLGQVSISGYTVSGAEAVIADAMRSLVAEPLVSVIVDHQRQQTYTVVGAVSQSGPYTIPAADYRLLEALGAAGGFSEAPEYIYIIRHIPLTEELGGRPTPLRPPSETEPQPTTPSPERLIDIIDEITAPRGNPAPGGSPAVLRPEAQPTRPPIDLIDNGSQPSRQATPEAVTPDPGNTTWVYFNNRWVRVQGAGQGAGVESVHGRPGPGTPLVTQRVIRIPLARLVNGDQRVNVVVRPGDVIRVPPPPPGNIYVLGQINRGGVYGMADRLTLQRLITAAGGLNALAIPERIDLTRMVGPDRQATIRLNGRAIFEGTHPDIYLKANDQINVGTNFWATPMAVIRNGFRASYGFGFLLDRNFGPDVFGAERLRFN